MRAITLAGSTIIVHESPRTIPEFRRVEHDYYALIDANIGSTIDDFDSRLEQIRSLIGSDDANAQLDAHNHLRFLYYNLSNKQYSPRLLSFCCLVETVDGEKWNDYTPQGVEALSRLLSSKGLTDEVVSEHWPLIKRQLYSELSESFPLQFPDNSDERFTLMQESLLLQIDELLTPDDETLARRKESFIYEIQQINKPAKLTGPNNVLDGMRSEYVDNRTFLQSEHLPVNDLTTSYDFWNSVGFMKRKYKPKTNTPDAVQ